MASDPVSVRAEALSPQKRALLERLRRNVALRQPGPIRRRTLRSPVRMSFAQQRLWFLDQLVPGNPFYSENSVIRLITRLDISAFEASLNEIIRRHEALRTTFRAVDGQPLQIIAPEM